MALPCPQRDALEALEVHVREWKTRCTENFEFFLDDGTRQRLNFLGVSNGTEMREKPDLHIAVFGYTPPDEGKLTNAHLLPKCRFGALLVDGRRGNWMLVVGLELKRVEGKKAILRLTRHEQLYRPVC